jgi:hypothetical protein
VRVTPPPAPSGRIGIIHAGSDEIIRTLAHDVF